MNTQIVNISCPISCSYLGSRDVLYKKESAQIGQDVSFVKMAGMS